MSKCQGCSTPGPLKCQGRPRQAHSRLTSAPLPRRFVDVFASTLELRRQVSLRSSCTLPAQPQTLTLASPTSQRQAGRVGVSEEVRGRSLPTHRLWSWRHGHCRDEQGKRWGREYEGRQGQKGYERRQGQGV
eukprot:358487-Chlamydomonas_euryale.AAC.18